jgi:hypothetical protein
MISLGITPSFKIAALKEFQTPASGAPFSVSNEFIHTSIVTINSCIKEIVIFKTFIASDRPARMKTSGTSRPRVG